MKRTIPLAAWIVAGVVSAAEGANSKADIRDEYLHDGRGNITGIVVHVGPLSLPVHTSVDDAVSAGSITVHRKRGADRRDESFLLQDGSPAARFAFASEGRVERVDWSNGMSLSVTPQGSATWLETLSIAGGQRKIFETVVSTAKRMRPTDVCLDVVAEDYGLGDDWQTNVTLTRNESGTLTTVSSGGRAILYVVHNGPDKAAFDADGKAVFVDLFADIYRRPASHAENWAGIQPMIPDHVIVTADGRVGAYVGAPAPGAVRSMWEDRSHGQVRFMYRVGAETHSRSASAASTRSHVPHARHTDLPARSLSCREVEDVSQSCWSDSLGNSGCSPPTYTDYWVCDDSSSGGGTSSGGGSTSSNQVTGDVILSQKVAQGLSNATTKLQSQQCQALLSSNYDSDGHSLLSIMNARSFQTASDYLNQGVAIVNGTGTSTCDAGVVAWVSPPGITVVHACPSYKNLTVGMAGVALIHEMLHTLGLNENPPTAGAMTPDQITNMVAAACGAS